MAVDDDPLAYPHSAERWVPPWVGSPTFSWLSVLCPKSQEEAMVKLLDN